MSERLDAYIRSQIITPIVVFIWHKTGKNHYMQAHYVTSIGTVGWLVTFAYIMNTVRSHWLLGLALFFAPIMLWVQYKWASEYAKAAKAVSGKEDTHEYYLQGVPNNLSSRLFWLWSGLFCIVLNSLFTAFEHSWAERMSDIGNSVWWASTYIAAAIAATRLPPRKKPLEKLAPKLAWNGGNA